jgi:hypothetical protein
VPELAEVDESAEKTILEEPVPLTSVKVPEEPGEPVPTVTREVPLLKSAVITVNI